MVGISSQKSSGDNIFETDFILRMVQKMKVIIYVFLMIAILFNNNVFAEKNGSDAENNAVTEISIRSMSPWANYAKLYNYKTKNDSEIKSILHFLNSIETTPGKVGIANDGLSLSIKIHYEDNSVTSFHMYPKGFVIDAEKYYVIEMEIFNEFCDLVSTLKSENPKLKRDELADAVMSTYEYVTQEFSLPIAEQPIFNDINGSPYQMRILQAYTSKFMNGVGDMTFEPMENVTREQLAVVLYRLVSKLNTKHTKTQEIRRIGISDLDNVSEWAKEPYKYMMEAGFMTSPYGTFKPQDIVTHAELMEVTDLIKIKFAGSYNEKRTDFNDFLDKKGMF